MANNDLEGRNGKIWRGYTIYRKTLEALAAEYGLSHQRVSQIIAKVKANIPDHDRAEMRQASIEFYNDMMTRAVAIADLPAAPVAVGKDGDPLYDPETGEVVRDFSGQLRAMETAGRFENEMRKLMGLDTPTKTEIASSVRYEIVGIDPEALK